MLSKLRRLWDRFFGGEPRIDTLKELQRARRVEDQLEQVTKLLKCTPDEMLTRLNKIQAHILELEEEKKRLESSK